MGYIIAYLLLALVIDLIREIINPEGDHRNAAAIRRRLWSDTDFDCRSKVFSVEGNTVRQPTRNTQSQSKCPWRKRRPWFAWVCKAHGLF
jgi:hypothetical protein